MYDVIAIGECLIDFVPLGQSERGNDLFEKNPGGAPANVLAFLAKLNKQTGFIGKVGNDQFGKYLKQVLDQHQIDTTSLSVDHEVNTTLAFVHLKEDGDRAFSFYRNPGADINLKIEDVNFDLIKNTKILHFGSLSLTHNPARETTFRVLAYAKQQGKVISYDPNLRAPLWTNLMLAKEMMRKGMGFADIVKASEEELAFLTNEKTVEAGAQQLLNEFANIKLLLITLGSKGSCFFTKQFEGHVDGFKVKAIDTTGAGDSFLGGMLYCLLETGLKVETLSKEQLEAMLRFANAGASIVTTRYGAIASMPTKQEIEAVIHA